MDLSSIIHITAQYSNAVLVAILPHVTSYSENLDLPIERPVRLQHVSKFVCGNRQGEVGGWLTLTNNFQFWFSRGHVDTFEAPENFFALQNLNRITNYFGPTNLSVADGISLGKRAVRRLGYSEYDLFMNLDPEVEGPMLLETNCIPFYRVVWKNPEQGWAAVSLDIDAKQGCITRLAFISTNLWRPPPQVAVKPVTEAEYQARIKNLKPPQKKITTRRPDLEVVPLQPRRFSPDTTP